MKQNLSQHSISPRDVLDSLYGERSPGHVHFSGDLARIHSQPQHPTDVGHVLHRDSEGYVLVNVERISVLRLRHYLLTELSAHFPKVGTCTEILRPFGERIISDLAQPDDETSDSLEDEAINLCGDELMPWGIGVRSEFEIVHDLLSVAGVGTPETIGDSPIVVFFVKTAGGTVAHRMPAVEVVVTVDRNVIRWASDQDSGEALVAASLVAALDSEGRISVVVHSIILTPSQGHSSDSPLKWARKIDSCNLLVLLYLGVRHRAFRPNPLCDKRLGHGDTLSRLPCRHSPQG